LDHDWLTLASSKNEKTESKSIVTPASWNFVIKTGAALPIHPTRTSFVFNEV
jgi:hypothetical protein